MSIASLRELSDAEIDRVFGGGKGDGHYSKENCVTAWTGIGMFMGGFIGGGLGAELGGLLGTWYGNQVCKASR